MGGMAALISRRLPADKANGCGEAWASALLRNKHFHFVWLEWRMERWKWWIDDLRSSGGGRERGRGRWMEWMWMLFNINRSIRAGWWNMHFVNCTPPFGQRGDITIMWRRWKTQNTRKAALGHLSPRHWINIASNNNNPVAYQKKWIYIFMALSSDDFMIIISELLRESMMGERAIASVCSIWRRKATF